MKQCNQDISDAIISNYVDYARHTIIERAIPDYRDGLKPVQRRILYSMHENNQYIDASGKNGKTYKSARVVGDVMGKYHPHGDSSIYGAIVSMTDDYDDMLLPYVKGEGTFGRVWSEESAGHMRYTEVALNKIAREMFDGISDDCIDFIDNYDGSEKEPSVLPSKFPSVLVNNTMGIAVCYASNLPRFELGTVCKATSGIINGTIDSVDNLVDVLGYPDFTTGGNLHKSLSELKDLYNTGSGKFSISGSVVRKGSYIDIVEVPYNTTIEKILGQIKRAIDDKKILDIVDFKNSSGFSDKLGKACPGIHIELKRGADDKKVLAQLIRYTDLRATVSFNMTVLINNKPERIGVFDLIKNWIEWRQEVVQRQYSFKLNKEKEKLHLLESWELIADSIKEVARLIASYKEADVKELLYKNYGLDDIQSEYLYERKIRTLTTDRLNSELNKLKVCRENVKVYEDLVNNKNSRLKLIDSQLKELIEDYPSVRHSRVVDSVKEDEENELLNEKIEDVNVYLAVNRKGFIKRAMSFEALEDIRYKYEGTEDEVVKVINSNNLESLLVFTSKGECIKYPVHKIDNSSRSKFNENIKNLVKLPDSERVVHIDSSGDFSKSILIVYGNGKANYLGYDYLSGNRSRYKSLYCDFDTMGGGVVINEYKPIYLISNLGKASYVPLGNINAFGKARFRLVQPSGKEVIKAILYKDDALDIDSSEYERAYTVKIRTEIFENEDKFIKIR